MENSKIEWTDHTFNPWIGCAKVSLGCTNCYAESLMDTRLGRVRWGMHGTRKRTSTSYWQKPLKWNQEAEKNGGQLRVFCASLADVFEDREELREWRIDLWKLIDLTPNLDWLLLTKRPENISKFMMMPYPENVWIGTSVENQRQADVRIPKLLNIPVQKRFLSCEPLLGEVNLINIDGISGIKWIIVGDESGPNRRSCELSWVQQLRDQAHDIGALFFLKQLHKNGKKVSMPTLDGWVYSATPTRYP